MTDIHPATRTRPPGGKHVNSFNVGRCAAEYQPTGKAANELRTLFGWLQGAGIIPAARKGQAA